MNAADQLAEALADRRPVDWSAALRDAATPDERQAIEALRDLALLSDAFAGDLARRSDRASGRPALEAGTEWGGLRVVESIGRGRFGEVYRAWDPVLEREVALKLIQESDDTADTRVIDEGRLMARVRHPNVVTIHGAQRIDGVTGLSMEFIEGRTLDAELAARGPFDPAELARVAADLAGALEAVHQAGLVHRDVKATNVIREASGRIVLGDFGTGRVADSTDEPTGLAGTPAYIAPEIFQGRPATPRSDLYSLGVLLFYLATRDYPVSGRTLRELRAAHTAADRSRLSTKRPDLPAPLVEVIDRLLEPDPEKRFATAAAVTHAITRPAPRAIGWRTMAAGAVLAAVAAAVWQPWRPAPPNGGAASDPPSAPPIDRPASVTLPAAVDAAKTPAPSPPAESGGEARKPGPSPPGLVLFPDHTNLTFRGVATNGMIACQHAFEGDVAVCDLHTGTPRVLREYENATSFAPQGRSTFLSPDGARVAYVWVTGPEKAREQSVNVIPAAGGAGRELYRTGPGRASTMHRWRADSAALLMSEPDGDGRRVFLLPADGGPQVDIWRLPAGHGTFCDLSADGRYLVTTVDDGPSLGRVVIVDRETKQEQVAFDGRGGYPLWTPSADAVVFETALQGGSVVMRVPVQAGAAAGRPEVAWRFGRATVRPIAFGADGTLFLMHSPPIRTAYRVEVDLPRARVGKPLLIDPLDVEDTIGADWSPDGRQIAYLRGRMWIGPRGPRATVVVRNVNGGIVNEIEVPGGPLPGVSQVRWSPDGLRLAVVYDAGESAGGNAIDVIDLYSRARQRILQGPTYATPRWDSTGEWLYYKQVNAIMRRRLATGTTELVYRAEGFGIRSGDAFDRNRVDGAIAILAFRQGTPGCVLRIVEVSGAVIDRQTFDQECLATAWTVDGTALLVSTNASATQSSLWHLNRAGGDPVRLPINEPMYHVLSHGPGGLLYTTGNPRFSLAMLTGIATGR